MLRVPLGLVDREYDAALPGVVSLKFHRFVRWDPWGAVGWKNHEMCYGSM